MYIVMVLKNREKMKRIRIKQVHWTVKSLARIHQDAPFSGSWGACVRDSSQGSSFPVMGVRDHAVCSGAGEQLVAVEPRGPEAKPKQKWTGGGLSRPQGPSFLPVLALRGSSKLSAGRDEQEHDVAKSLTSTRCLTWPNSLKKSNKYMNTDYSRWHPN